MVPNHRCAGTWRTSGSVKYVRPSVCIEPPQCLQLLLLLYLCRVLVPFITVQLSRKGFAFHLLQVSTKPSVGLSSSEDAVWQSTHHSFLPQERCMHQTGDLCEQNRCEGFALCSAVVCSLLFLSRGTSSWRKTCCTHTFITEAALLQSHGASVR